MGRPAPVQGYDVPDHHYMAKGNLDINKVNELRAELEGIGGTRAKADQIAAHLIARGIKGRRNSGCDCPVANWFSRTLGVGGAVAGNAFQLNNDVGVQLGLTDGICDFVRRFDAGEYPDLVEQEVASA